MFSNASSQEKKVQFFLDSSVKFRYTFNPSLLLKRCSLKIRINEPISVNIGSFKSEFKGTQKTYEVRALKESRKTKVNSFSFNSGEERQTEIELKSLILAQIERWRHALHMQVERQHRELAPGWRVAHG